MRNSQTLRIVLGSPILLAATELNVACTCPPGSGEEASDTALIDSDTADQCHNEWASEAFDPTGAGTETSGSSEDPCAVREPKLFRLQPFNCSPENEYRS